MKPGRTRLDQCLVARGIYPTRAKARDAILRGAVFLDGRPAIKPSQVVNRAVQFSVKDPAQDYVSRSALKLKHALEHFAVHVEGCLALDLGASTGGFTQILLERGASKVYAVDVGHDQLAPVLRNDPRVVHLERLNARDLSLSHLEFPPEIIVCDVSFISLKLALGPALALAAPAASLIALIKPQFEAGTDALDASGIVRDPSVHRQVCDDIVRWLDEEPQWRVIGFTASPITGGDGNREFLLAAKKDKQ